MRRVIGAEGLFAPSNNDIVQALCVYSEYTRENAATVYATFDGFLPFRFARTGNRLPAVAAVVLQRVCAGRPVVTHHPSSRPRVRL